MNIQIHDAGKLTGLLKTRPFMVGEIFIQDENQDLGNRYLVDANNGAHIVRLSKGDLYGGANSWYGNNNGQTITGSGISELDHPLVYQLGSGSSLKFGNELLYKFADGTGNVLNDVKNLLETNPNTLYLYVGPKDPNGGSKSAFGDNSKGDDLLHQSGSKLNTETDTTETTYDVVGDANNRYGTDGSPESYVQQYIGNVIDTNDLVFYSPIYKQIFVWHLSRSQASLVRLNYEELASNSLNTEFKTELKAGFTLKDFLDKVGRYFQRLTEDGWTEVEVTKSGTPVAYTFNITGAKEGNIFYIPFLDSNGDYIQPETEIGGNNLTCNPGDLIMAVAKADGTFELKKVSILSEFLKKHSLTDFITLRADGYASERWETPDDTTNEKDTTFLSKVHSGEYGLPEVLNRFGGTKADIDPATGKVVTSQIPSFILGGLKRVNVPNNFETLLTSIGDDTYSIPTGLEDLSKGELLAAILSDPTDFEWDEDGLTYANDSEGFDKEILGNIYFIWKGNPYKINLNDPFFTKQDAKDVESIGTPIKEINKGDMLIFNSELGLFEVIDNSTELVSIMARSRTSGVFEHAIGTPSFITNLVDRETFVEKVDPNNAFGYSIVGSWDDQHRPEEIEIRLNTDGDIEFTNPFGVKGLDNDANYLPLINNKQVAYNSLFKVFASGDTLGPSNSESVKDSIKLDGKSRGLTYVPKGTTNDIVVTEGGTSKAIKATTPFVWIYGDDAVNGSVFENDYTTMLSTSGNVYLPNVPGTLATLEELNSALYTALKAIKDALDNHVLTGTENFLQTIKETTLGEKELVDSPIEFATSGAVAQNNAKVEAKFHVGDGLKNSHDDTVETNDIVVEVQNSRVVDNTSPDWHSRITMTNHVPNAAEADRTLPAKGNDSNPVKNVLPNFDGILLNTNSIIFCGYWTDND